MTLKTLKDIESKYCFCGEDCEFNLLVNDLKQEAIKWIKVLKKEDNTEEYLYMDGFCLKHMKVDNCSGTLGLSWAECSDIPATIIWIKHFFNITEENLK